MFKGWIKGVLVCALACLPVGGLRADFGDSTIALHPSAPGTDPFIIEITGTWPTDCHPGEQKPVVSAFDGQAVEIGFEIIVVHVVCNEVETDYRVLVDMYPAVTATPPASNTLDIAVEFQGMQMNWQASLACPAEIDCIESGEKVRPERGLFITPERKDEGLLIARQNDTTVIYPLVYDDSGRGEWLISVGPVNEGSFFSELFRSRGGDCFDCEPTHPDTELVSAGHLSVLVDDPAELQVKVNDRLFQPYTKLVYGYKGPKGGPLLASLAGRWALSDNQGTDPPLGDITNFLPPAFDITLQSLAAGEPTQVMYGVQSLTGDELGQVVCGGMAQDGQPLDYCEFIDETDQADPLFRIYPLGPSTLDIQYGRPVISIGIPPRGTAVRLD